MKKIYDTCNEAIADINDGATIMLGGLAFAAFLKTALLRL